MRGRIDAHEAVLADREKFEATQESEMNKALKSRNFKYDTKKAKKRERQAERINDKRFSKRK